MRLSLLWAALAVVFVLTGCAGSRALPDEASSLSDVNDALTNRTARLYLDGTSTGQNASLVTMTRDSVYYVDGILSRHETAPHGDRPMRQVHISSVDSIAVKGNGGGGRAGAVVGAMPGLITGAGFGFSLLDGCQTTDSSDACALGAIVTGLYTVVVAGGGAVIGALIGNAIDDDVWTVYRAPVDSYLERGGEATALDRDARR